jgi:peptide/nickel transport system substrate-binding protein
MFILRLAVLAAAALVAASAADAKALRWASQNDAPLHHQLIMWSMSDKVDMPIFPNDSPNFKYAKMK